MKKLLLIVTVLTLGLTTIGAEFLGWNCTDVTAMQAALEDTTLSAMQKNFYEVKIAYLANPENFDTWEKFLAQVKPIAEKNSSNEARQKTLIAQLVYCNATGQREVYFKDAYEYCSGTSYQLNFLYWGNGEKYLELSKQEVFEKLAAAVVDTTCTLYCLTRVIDTMTRIDARLDKELKIQEYSLIYEKYYVNLSDTTWVPILTKLALKLKSLGVEVN